MKKYYDLIVSLIKANRRYPECEDILEDIIEDVYAHADVVLNSVTNESVITSYLNKIVTTSMVTVPKRLGITSGRAKSTSSSEELIAQIENLETKANNSEFIDSDEKEDLLIQDESDKDNLLIIEEEPTSEELIDESNTNNSDTEEIQVEEPDELPIETSTTEINSEELETSALENSFEEADDLIIENYISNEHIIESNINENESVLEEEEILDLSQEKTTDVDKTLVDKMINGVSSDNIEIETELEEESIVPEDTLQEDTSFAIEDIDSELNLDLDTEFTELQESEVLPLDEISEEGTELIEEVEDDTNESVTDSDDEISSFKIFEYSPQQNVIGDYSELISEIDSIAAKHPDLNILDVFKLKYQKKLSIEDIAKELDMSDDDVIKALNELMYIVKE